MTRCTLPGPFSSKDLGHGRWLLTNASAPSEVLLRIESPAAAEFLAAENITKLDLDWRTGTVMVTVTRRQGVSRLDADSAIVHEPKVRLYDALPLTGFDPAAKRFWRRVFALMRIPGGRWLLRLIARRRR